jgi:hypothetical protein
MPKYLNQIILKENKKIFNKVIEEINNKYKCECSICFELTNNKTNCGHDVCLDCENKIKNNKCPLCRRNLKLKRILPSSHTMSPTISIINNVINEFSTFPNLLYFDFDFESLRRIDELHKQLFEAILENIRSRFDRRIWLSLNHSFSEQITFINCRVEHLEIILSCVGHLEHSLEYNIDFNDGDFSNVNIRIPQQNI